MAYRWQMELDNGTLVDEPARWADLDLSRVVVFRLLPDDDTPPIELRLLPGQRIIFRWRHGSNLNPLTGAAQSDTTYIVGIKQDGHTAYLFVHPDGAYSLSHDFDAVY